MLMDLRKVHRPKSCQRFKYWADRLNASLTTSKVDTKLGLLFLSTRKHKLWINILLYLFTGRILVWAMNTGSRQNIFIGLFVL